MTDLVSSVNFGKVLIVDVTDQPLEGGPPTAEAAKVRLGESLCKGEVSTYPNFHACEHL